MESFLIDLCLALLEKLLVKGSQAFGHYLALKDAVQKAKEYQKVVDKPTTREERRRAEDDLLS
jgi:hypothetical protein